MCTNFQELTIYPCNAHCLKNSHKQKAHPTGGIIVKELEDIHPTLVKETQIYCMKWSSLYESEFSGAILHISYINSLEVVKPLGP